MGKKSKKPKEEDSPKKDTSTNLSDKRRLELEEKIKRIKKFIEGAPEDDNRERLLKDIADIEEGLDTKQYGLLYEEHMEKIDEELKKNIPVLTEFQKPFSVSNKEGEVHFLIEGDNLASLQLLERTHTGKIDLIYIDPPYNTGHKDFCYGDNFVGENDAFRHSKWLSFMSKRLKIAKNLLSERGVIFISIDDNEQAHLKLLCDEIFGEERFYGQLIQLKGNTQNDAKTIQKNHEYILVYSRQDSKLLLTYNNNVNYKIFEGRYYEGSINGQTGNSNTLFDRKNLGYTVYYKKGNEKQIKKGCELYPEFKSIGSGNSQEHAVAIADYDQLKVTAEATEDEVYKDVKELVDLGYVKIRPPKRKGGRLGRWTWELENFTKLWNEGTILIKNSKKIIRKEFVAPEDITEIKGKKYFCKINTLPIQSIVDIPNRPGTTVLSGKNGLIPGADFNNPKSVELIEFILKSYNHEEDSYPTILDFFAGSGTTGHAVMKLNSEDEGSRHFILCTNNEGNEVREEDGICRKITYKRLKEAMKRWHYKATLKYFRVDLLPRKERFFREYAERELLSHIRELVELENAINFTGNARIAIILSQDELEDFFNKDTKCKVVYLANKVVVDDERLLKLKGVEEINIIPDYYYRDLSR